MEAQHLWEESMPLKVIGAGLGRTGTLSLKLALEELGFGPCYHMMEVIANPPYAEHWERAAQGEDIDWDEVFQGYNSAVDWPACDYWRELSAHYPRAKVILTVRDPESWFASTQATIFSSLNTFAAQDNALGRTMRAIGDKHFGGTVSDHDACIAGLQRHNEAVKNSGLGDRLLVYRIAEGWEPLCRFLGVPVPATPFPTRNSTEEFREKVGKMVGQEATPAT
jgi:hypothetical protein